MPLRLAEQSTEGPRNEFPAAQAFAQTGAATPEAGRPTEPRSGLELPAGIRVLRDAATAAVAPGLSVPIFPMEVVRSCGPNGWHEGPET